MSLFRAGDPDRRRLWRQKARNRGLNCFGPLAECLQAYTERVGPLLGKTQGLNAAYLAGEEGESTLAIVSLFSTNREAAVAWLNGGGDKILQGTMCRTASARSS